MIIQNQLEQLEKKFKQQSAAAHTQEQIEQLRVQYVGRKSGELNSLLRSLKDLTDEEKKIVGPQAQALKQEIESTLDGKLRAQQNLTMSAKTDLTVPGIRPQHGRLHPVTQIMNDLVDIFSSMGFMVQEGPEMDHDYYNFEALNFPPGHPARDIQDTFFIKTPITRKEKRELSDTDWVMRTQTSNMQIRIMEKFQPPLRCIVPGRVYRNEATDARHEMTFAQLEGFVVDENVTIGNLTWTLREIFRQLYNEDIDVRLRPGFFPFTEPSYEIEMSCIFCEDNRAHCRVCKGSGWVEMAGSGMIHQEVFKAVGYEKGKYTGFAFGLGYMRLAMLKYNVPDVRMWMQNDIRFLEQF